MKTTTTVPNFVSEQDHEEIGTTKQEFIRRAVNETVEANPMGVTLSELQEALSFDRRTIGKHLYALTLTGDIYYIQRGRTKVYLSNLANADEQTRESARIGDDDYEAMTIQRPDGEYVYLRKGKEDASEGGFLVPIECFEEYASSVQGWFNKIE